MQTALKLDVLSQPPEGESACPVCGHDALTFDSVAEDFASGPSEPDAPGFNGDVLHLVECRHCEHRWTGHLRADSPRLAVVEPDPLVPTPRAPGVRGVASAA